MSRMLSSLALLATLASTISAQNQNRLNDPPSVATNGFIAFVERDTTILGGGADVVTIINTNNGAGATAGAAITPATTPLLPGGLSSNGTTTRWRLNGTFSRNEQLRGRQTSTESRLAIVDDTFNGRVMILAQTFGGGVSRLESLTVGPAGTVTNDLALGGTASGPYAITLQTNANRAFVSDYSSGNNVRVHAVDLGATSGTPGPSLTSTFTPPAGQNQVSQCSAYMVWHPTAQRLQFPTRTAMHSVQFPPAGLPTAVTIAVPAGQIVGTDVQLLTYGITANAVFGVRSASPGAVNSPGAGRISYRTSSPTWTNVYNFGIIQGTNRRWDLAPGFHTPAYSVRDFGQGIPRDLVTMLLSDPLGGPGTPGQVAMLEFSIAGSINYQILTLDSPFGDPEAARNGPGEPVMVMLEPNTNPQGTAIPKVQAFGVGSNFAFAQSGGAQTLTAPLGLFDHGRIHKATSLPGGLQWVVNADIGGSGIEVFSVAANAAGQPIISSDAVVATPGGGLSTSLTTPFLNGTVYGSAPFFTHGFAGAPMVGAGSPYAIPPFVAPVGVAAAPFGTPLPTGTATGVRIPAIQSVAPAQNVGPRYPVWTEDGALVNAVYHDLVGGSSRLSLFLGGNAAPATYSTPGGGVILSEIATF